MFCALVFSLTLGSIYKYFLYFLLKGIQIVSMHPSLCGRIYTKFLTSAFNSHLVIHPQFYKFLK